MAKKPKLTPLTMMTRRYRRQLARNAKLQAHCKTFRDHMERMVRERITYERMPSWPLVVQELEGHKLLRAHEGLLRAAAQIPTLSSIA